MIRTEKNFKLLSRIVANGYSQRSFAKATELAVGTVHGMVNGYRRPCGVTLQIVCKALNATPEELGLEEYDHKKHHEERRLKGSEGDELKAAP